MRFFSRHLIFKSPLDSVSTHSSNQFADYFPAPAHNESVRGPQTSSSFRIVDNASGTSTLDSLTNGIPSAVEGSGVAFGSPGADESTQKSGPQNVPEGQYENSPGCNPGFAAHKRPRCPVGTPRPPAPVILFRSAITEKPTARNIFATVGVRPLRCAQAASLTSARAGPALSSDCGVTDG